MKKVLKIVGIGAAALLLLAIAGSFVPGITPLAFHLHKPVYSTSGKALEGYDVISYFQGKPVKGSGQFAYTWQSSNWLFSSPELKEAFLRNPESITAACDRAWQ